MKYRLLTAIALCLAGQAAAQEAQNAPVIDRFKACRAIAVAAQRLACYDAASDAFVSAVSRSDVLVLDKAELARTRRSLFGFSLPNLSMLTGSTEKGEPVLNLETVIKKVRQVSYGRYDMEIDNGAVWRNVDLLDTEPSAGTKITINKTRVGGFLLKVPFSPSVHAMRVR